MEKLKISIAQILGNLTEDLHVDETNIQFNNKVHYDDDIEYNEAISKRQRSPSNTYNKKRNIRKYSSKYHQLRELPNRANPSEIHRRENLQTYHIKDNKTPITLPLEKSNMYKTSNLRNYVVSFPNGIHDLREKDENLFNAATQNRITERTDENSGIMILQVLLNIAQFIGIVFNSAIGKLCYWKKYTIFQTEYIYIFSFLYFDKNHFSFT